MCGARSSPAAGSCSSSGGPSPTIRFWACRSASCLDSSRHRAKSPRPAAPGGPGPFSMASPDVVAAQLKAAGFVDPTFTRVDGPVMVGRDLEQAIDFQMGGGPAGETVREAGDEAERRNYEIQRALRAELARHTQPDGSIVLD